MQNPVRGPTLAWGLIAPSLLLTIFILAYPLSTLVFQSVHDISRFGLLRAFNGLDNFRTVFTDPVFAHVVWRTVQWTVCVVGGAVLCAVPIALILQQDFYGRGVARTIVMLPWAVSLTMTAIVWTWSFNGQYGMVNASLAMVGVIQEPINWLADGQLAFWVEVGVGILVSIPFTVTIFLGGLSSVSQDIYEAADIEGASRWQQFRRLTLPLLKPFIHMAIVLNVIYVFNSFPIIWIMTQGGPDNATHILVTWLYQLGFRMGRPGEAAAISLVMLALLLAFTVFYLRLQKRQSAKAAT
ncbi:carbohydrate ABC transporter permease [Variovorax sp. 38R]|uniref:carbohydrate ABC transporter permease n=1 Tax=Variovorax sp. 38R TaxID=2774875 RepID=UPI00178013D5|nr:sugar ABC transporter permease [Variovorax sp. 38R]QOF77748.1 sugar ABC transporter permease [Variovorax sp. 38R]